MVSLPHSTLLLLASTALVHAADTYTSVGCFALSALESSLTFKEDYIYQSNSYCWELCGTNIAATLNGKSCYCGDSLPSDVSAQSSDNCNVPCNGWSAETCGGASYLNVYSKSGQSVLASSGSTTRSTSTSATSQSSSTTGTTTILPSTTSTSTSTSSLSSLSTSTSITTSSPSSRSSSSQTTSHTVAVITSIISASNVVQTVTATVSDTSPTASVSSASSTASSAGGSNSGLSKGAIAGIAIGSAVGVIVFVAVGVLIFIRARTVDEEEEEEPENEKQNALRPPIHNDLHSFYGFQQPLPLMPENGHKRFSNGSLPDARHEKTLRVVNPDNETIEQNHDTLQSHFDDGERSFTDTDSGEWDFTRRK